MEHRATRVNGARGTAASGALPRPSATRVGTPTLDCDVLGVASGDPRIMICTAGPGTEDAARRELLAVLGTRSPTG
ncbi:hypothetical protein [Streptomyces sp. NPDC017202]|uniref:hypothetical protein n=1 Tax=Streptomyces sp. NPDC017202 TaxID=3364981 RepID=UPI0037B33EFF